MNISLALMAGTDIPIPELQLTMHQPRIKEIAFIGEDKFFQAVQCICLRKEQLVQDKSLLSSLDNFQVLMKVMEQKNSSDKKQALIMLLQLLFPDYQPLMTPQSILLRNGPDNTTIIDSSNFEILQETAREVLCTSSMFQGDNVVYNPGNEAARKIAEKIEEGRRKVAAIKSKESGNDSILSRYISILTVGIGSMSLEDNLNLTIYQLFDLVERYSLWIDWDIDLRLRLAGGTPKQDAENWMKSIHSNS